MTVRKVSRSYYLAAPRFTTILDVTPLLPDRAMRSWPNAFDPAAVLVSHLQAKEN